MVGGALALFLYYLYSMPEGHTWYDMLMDLSETLIVLFFAIGYFIFEMFEDLGTIEHQYFFILFLLCSALTLSTLKKDESRNKPLKDRIDLEKFSIKLIIIKIALFWMMLPLGYICA